MLAIVPLGWAVTLAAAMSADPGLSTAMSLSVGAMVGLVALTAPAVAIILSDLADAAGERLGHAAYLLSGLLFFVTIVVLPRLLISVPAFVIALTVCLVALSDGLVLARRGASLRT